MSNNKQEIYECIMCDSISTNPDEMYVLEDRVNNKIYLRCKKCEFKGNKREITIIKKNKK